MDQSFFVLNLVMGIQPNFLGVRNKSATLHFEMKRFAKVLRRKLRRQNVDETLPKQFKS